ncbi:MAG: cellulase family glycosylhydrolase [Deltaproteobacteria bacterium]|nr:cellulase family glycosylhydrolase [Deltaproteobacteria bacterium]MCL5276178.1 cellulase family glycosylhydrolase [Deltaproteobacteria bacterium]
MPMKGMLLSSVFVMVALFAAGCSRRGPDVSAVVHDAVWSDAPWLRDTQGRVIVVHGVNVSQKVPPYLPDNPPAATISQTTAYFANIRQAGFDAVRLIIIWAGLEPSPGSIDTDYLDQIQQEVQICGDDGLLVLLDMHQDLYSQYLCYGDGAPEWACDLSGYDVGQCNTSTWGLNYTVPAVMQSFQNFWDDKPAPDGVGLQEHYTAVFQAVARRFSGTANVLGYEIMNEPFPGRYSPFTTDFEVRALVPFYEKVAQAIRTVDASHLIAFEPSAIMANVFHNYNTGISGTTFSQDVAGLVFVPHYYPLSFGSSIDDSEISSLQSTIPSISHVSSVMKAPYIIGEMGLDHNEDNSAAYMTALLNEFDSELSNWMFWAYGEAFGESGGMMLLGSTGNDAFPIMDILTRPYPMLTAGTPVSISYPITTDPASFSTTTFTYTYKEDGIGHGTTELYLPRLHFPDGFTVTTTDGSASFDPSTGVLSYTRGPRSTHTITVIPCKSGAPDCILFLQ